MPITFEQYISEFEEIDEYGDLAERLKEELHDHFDDSVHAFMICGTKENEAEQRAFQNLGESKKIIHEFKTIMKFNNKIALWLESLFFGILSIPIFHLITRLFGFIIDSASGFGIGWKGVVVGTLLYILSLGFLSLFYFFVVGKFIRFLDKKKDAWSLMIGLFLPSILFAIIYQEFLQSNLFYGTWYFFVSIIPGILLYVSFIYFAFRKKTQALFARSANNKKNTASTKQKLSEYISFFISLVCIPVIVLSNNMFVPFDSSVNRSFVDFLAFIRYNLEPINIPILEFHINGLFGGYEGFYILAAIYIFLAFVSLYKIGIFLFEKTAAKRFVDFPWLRLTLLVYIFSLFFLVQVPEKANIKWEVPLRNISSEIKHEQLGMLYRFGTYFSHVNTVFQKSFYLYEIIKNDTALSIRVPDNEGMPHEYILAAKNNQRTSLNSLKSLNDFELSKVREEVASGVGFYHGPKELPVGVECITEEGKPAVYSWETGSQNSATLDTNLFYKYCHKLSYKGKLIYTQEEANRLYQFEIFSKNPRFVIVRIETGEYGPQEVYLVDLR